jgi:hypothetical protein
MININTEKEIHPDNNLGQISQKYFNKYTNEDSKLLSSNEFYSFLENFLEENNKKELFSSFRDENLFKTYIDKNSEQMNYEQFNSAFNDLMVLVKGDDTNLDVDFKFDNEDLDFTF